MTYTLDNSEIHANSGKARDGKANDGKANDRKAKHVNAENGKDDGYDQSTGDNPQLTQKLRDAGLRPTRQRTALAEILFDQYDRHVSAEQLFEEARQANIAISLAT